MALVRCTLLTLLLLSGTIHAEPLLPDTPAGRWTSDFIEMFNRADGREAERFTRDRLTPAFIEQTFGGLDNALLELARLRHELGPLEIESVETSSPLELSVTAQGRITQRSIELMIRTSAEDPPRLENLELAGVTPVDRPANRLNAVDLERELDAYLSTLAEHDLFSGVVVIEEDNVRLFEGAYGRRNPAGEPVTLDTRFPLASMSKMFTAVAIAQLQEAGLLEFDAPVAHYLPELPSSLTEGITVRHLLSHTSGLGNFDFSRLGADMSVDDMLALQTDRAPWPPGERFRYSNMGYILLGAVIERVTGRDYYDVIASSILEPTGMARTGAEPLDEATPGYATGFVVDAEEWRRSGVLRLKFNRAQRVPRATPAGDYLSTAEDLLAFAEGLRKGLLVDPPTLEILATPQQVAPYGHGFQAFPNGLVGHGGGAAGEDTHLAMDLRAGLTIVVLANYDRSAASVVRHIDRLLGLD